MNEHDPRHCENWIEGRSQPGTGPLLAIEAPRTGRRIGTVRLSQPADVNAAVASASRAWPEWRERPLRERVELLLRFRERLVAGLEELAGLVALESGKTEAEARAGIQRGLEVVDFAASLPNLDEGRVLEVSRGVTCEVRREPLGVVTGITPFNFPAMVPLWMFPIALTTGNVFILKPSEKVPLSASRMAEWMSAAGYPAGVFQVVHGDRHTVEALVEHPRVSAIAFVGSTPVARAVYVSATALGKRALCLGGAKNHLIVAPDADEALTSRAVVDSFTGCAGQRCMAGSVLVVVGAASRLVPKIAEAARALELGRDMGALIDRSARERIVAAIGAAEQQGATVLADGRSAKPPAGCEGGFWLGPTVLDQVRPEMACAQDELFGPVLSVVHVGNLDEALRLEGASPYGNATSVFTASGAVARYVSDRATSGMVGINVGVPVPRDPFPFGGSKQSKFGHGDMTGRAAVEFWTNLKKITTKWAAQRDSTWMS